jgi:hypothetical protein
VEPVSSLFALITFSWVWPIMWKGYWEPLDMKDVWDLREDDHAFHVLKKFRTSQILPPNPGASHGSMLSVSLYPTCLIRFSMGKLCSLAGVFAFVCALLSLVKYTQRHYVERR